MKNQLKKPTDRTQWLEEELRKKEQLLKQYKKALKISNERVRNISEELRSGVSLIRKIHTNLMPVEIPNTPHFKFSYKIQAAAKGISGDFFDIIPLQDPMKFGILLSSCNNYALTTLFLSSLLKSSGPLREQQTAKDFLCHLSDEIFSSLSKKETVHIFYGIVNRRDFTLDYCVAGHVFAGLRSSNQPVTILPVCSKTVHKNNKNLFVSHTTTLQSGDALVICSPGVLDRVNKQGKTFGSSAIAGILNNNPSSGALEIRQKILFYADEFANRKPFHKDQTVLALEVKERILKLA